MSNLVVYPRLMPPVAAPNRSCKTSEKRIEPLAPAPAAGDHLAVGTEGKAILQRAARMSRSQVNLGQDRPGADLGTSMSKTLLSSLIAAGMFRDAAPDKLLHAVASAAICTGVAEATNNPGYGMLAATGVGLAKEMADSSPLNPGGSRDVKDLAADLAGAGIAFGVSLAFWMLEAYLRHRQIQQIPDQLALYSLLQASAQEPAAAHKFSDRLLAYPGQAELLELARQLETHPHDRRLQAGMDKKLRTFNHYLIGSLRPEIAAAKKRLGKASEEALKQDKVRQALQTASTAGMLVRNATPLVNAATRLVRGAVPAARLLYKAAPGLAAISTAIVAYDTAKDLENPQYDHRIKALSLGELGWSSVSVASFFLPLVGLPLAIASIAGGIATHLLKSYAIRRLTAGAQS